ncbi:hypothetical protein [Azospirillum argentinense]
MPRTSGLKQSTLNKLPVRLRSRLASLDPGTESYAITAKRAIKEARILRNLLNSCKQRLKKKYGNNWKKYYNLNIETIPPLPYECPVFPHIVLKPGIGIVHDASPTLDRVDPLNPNYDPNNVQICSYRANRLRSDASAYEIQLLADWQKDTLGKDNYYEEIQLDHWAANEKIHSREINIAHDLDTDKLIAGGYNY